MEVLETVFNSRKFDLNDDVLMEFNDYFDEKRPVIMKRQKLTIRKNLKNIKFQNCRKGRSIFHIKCRNKMVF